MSRFWNFLSRGFRGRPSPGSSSSQTSSQASAQAEDSETSAFCTSNAEEKPLHHYLLKNEQPDKYKSRLVLIPDERAPLTWPNAQRTYQNYNSFHNSYAGSDCRDSVFYGAASALFLGQIVRYIIGVVLEKNFKKKHKHFIHGHQETNFSRTNFLTTKSILPKVPASFYSTAHAAGGSGIAVKSSNASSSNASSSVKPTPPSKVEDKPFLREDDLEEFYSSTKKCLGMTYNVEGVKRYKEGDYQKAFDCFKFGSRGGSVKAQFNLGICYQQGQGTKQNIKLAKKEYFRAANQGHKIAQYNLALILLEEANKISHIQGLRLLEKAAEKGVVEAQSLRGSYYARNGNLKKAVKLFQLAADQEDILSTYHLAQCYEHGLGGLEVDISRAFDLYASAASLGHLEAQFKMAMILFRGCSEIEQDKDLALELLKKGEEVGHKNSSWMVKVIEDGRKSVEQSRRKSDVTPTANTTFPVDMSPFLLSGLFSKLSSPSTDTPDPEMRSLSHFPVVNFPLGRHVTPLGLHRVSSWPSNSLHNGPAAISHSVKQK